MIVKWELHGNIAECEAIIKKCNLKIPDNKRLIATYASKIRNYKE